MTAAVPRWEIYDHPEIQRRFAVAHADGLREAALIIEGIHCGGCVRRCERGLADTDGVDDFQVNLATRRARLVWDPARTPLSTVLARLAAIGYPAWPYDPARQENRYRDERNRALKRLALAGFGMMQVMMFAVALYAGSDMDSAMRGFLRWMSLLVATPVVLYSARPFFANAWSGLRNRQLGMDVPVAIAIGSAFLASAWATASGGGEVYFDSVTMFTFLLLAGRFLEMGARHRAAAASEDLTRLLPALATRLTEGGTEQVPMTELRRGDRVLVRPGETVPADGLIEAGGSSLDEALITGESQPRLRKTGERVIGGSVNVESPLTVVIDRVGQDTVLSAMNRLLARAQLEKPHLARLADGVAGVFVAVLLLVALGVYLWWLRFAPADAFWITLSVLVVTCPCALSLATPAALTAATGALTRLGLLVTRGHALETLARVDRVIFDKTGTLTFGRLRLVDTAVLGELSAERCLAIAASLEQRSEHPVGKALCAAAGAVLTAADEVRAQSGRGVEGQIEGRWYRIGSPRYVAELSGVEPPPDDASDGATRVALGDERGLLALFSLADELRPQARDAVAGLRALGLEVSILSGDSPAAVARVAADLGIEHYHAAQLPDDKLVRVTQQQRDHVVLMVGDGVNDSPVLARAQVSVAMGGGTELARSHADLVLLGERLDRLPGAILLGRRTLAVIRQNLIWALVYNAVALPLAAAGFIAPWMAAVGMSTSSLVVVLNALRLGWLGPDGSPVADDTASPVATPAVGNV